ncbi:MAG: hypothetical protein JWN84_1105 [Nocardioides sp.]|jgi:hypothetical protein|nr:hypothetical protein [Nocardioides sp.]
MRTALAGILVASSLAVPVGLTATAPGAAAHPCDHSRTWSTTRRVEVRVTDRVNGSGSTYNRTQDLVSRTVTYGKLETQQVTKKWEVGAKVEGGWGPVKAEISGKYGEDYVEAATTSTLDALKMDVRPGHTGWIQAVFYTRNVRWQSYIERYNSRTGSCDKRLVQQALWGGPKVQLVPITRKGRVYPQ